MLIAGGGIIGLSIAWRLASAGCKVTLCDKNRFGAEASWAAAGMLPPGGEFTERSDEAELAMASRALYPEFVRGLEAASGTSIDYQERGALELAFTPDELASLNAKAVKQEAELGIASKSVMPARAGTFWPRLDSKSLAGARFYPGDALVDPRDLTRALAMACSNAGVEVREGVRVNNIHLNACGYDRIVIAAGAWSSAIGIDGVPPLPPCEPVRGQIIAWQQPAQTCPTIIRQGRNYMLQRANGLLLVGASMERAGFDREVSPAVTEELWQWAGTVLPHLAETAPEMSWVGFRPASDGLQLGPWHSERVLLAYGHFRNGVLLAPVTAQRIAAML